MKIELVCIHCKNKFETEFKFRDKKYCSRKCYFADTKKNKISGRKINPLIRESRKCIICNTEFITKIKTTKKMCSDECRKKWNSIEENKINRIKATKESYFKNHGVKSVFDNEEFKKNRQENFFKKYGVYSPMHVEKFLIKLRDTLNKTQIKKLIPKLYENDLELIDNYSVNKIRNTSLSYNFKCLKCSNIFSSTLLGSGKIPICRKCYPLVKNSKIEEFIRDFLNSNNINHLDSDRKILNGLEIDLLLNEHKLGIEVNGCYYHSETMGKKDKKYHLNKSILANKKDIKLIHIFEDEILYKPEIVKSRISNLLNITKNKVYARKCVIREISKKESEFFLNNNHIQGSSIDKIRIGLFYGEELISIMTFGGLRKSMGYIQRENFYELLRFCNKLNTNVIGGFSKLLKYFIINYTPQKIITYADIRWSGLDTINNVYYKNGFKYLGNTPPNYWYLKVGEYNNRFHRFNFRKDILIKEGFKRELTEFEIMKIKGYDRIWDCGNMKFEFDILPTGASFQNI
jgi:hypothetical protein